MFAFLVGLHTWIGALSPHRSFLFPLVDLGGNWEGQSIVETDCLTHLPQIHRILNFSPAMLQSILPGTHVGLPSHPGHGALALPQVVNKLPFINVAIWPPVDSLTVTHIPRVLTTKSFSSMTHPLSVALPDPLTELPQVLVAVGPDVVASTLGAVVQETTLVCVAISEVLNSLTLLQEFLPSLLDHPLRPHVPAVKGVTPKDHASVGVSEQAALHE